MSSQSEVPLQSILNINRITNDVKIIEKEGKKLVKGSRGHNSFFLKKPIVEGKYYIEMIGHRPEALSHNYKYEPNFRVGLAPTEYYYNYPLGQNHSVCYKSDGSIVTRGKKQFYGLEYNFQDVIGIGISILSAYKNRDKGVIAPKNYVSFYKNGEKAGEDLHILTEDLYSFSGSLFNEAEIELAIDRNRLKYLPEGYASFADYLQQQIFYIDKQFNNFKIDL